MNDDILTVEILDYEEPLEATIDFTGEFVSGSDGEDYKRGYADGETQGLTVGRAEGYNNGYNEGHTSGYTEGKEDGLTEGYDNGYTQGYEDGYAEAKIEWYNDGNTHIWIHLGEGRTSPMLGCCPNGTVTVDWGDGSANDILTGTSVDNVKWTPTHNYATAGDYVITLTADGTVGLFGNSFGSYILRHSIGWDNRNHAYLTAIKKIEISDSVTSIGNSAFYSCYSLSSVVIPNSVTSIMNYAFYGCYSLSSVVIPNSVTSIGNSAFYGCYSLSSVVIPDSVTSIGGDAFVSCVSVRYYDFTACTSIPTLTNTSAFRGIPDDCEIRVPSALYEEWINATNWSTYADHIVAV